MALFSEFEKKTNFFLDIYLWQSIVILRMECTINCFFITDGVMEMNGKITVSHLYPFENTNDEVLEKQFAEFEAVGCTDIALISKFLDRILVEPKFLIRLMMLAQDHKLRFSDAHGVWGPALGLGNLS